MSIKEHYESIIQFSTFPYRTIFILKQLTTCKSKLEHSKFSFILPHDLNETCLLGLKNYNIKGIHYGIENLIKIYIESCLFWLCQSHCSHLTLSLHLKVSLHIESHRLNPPRWLHLFILISLSGKIISSSSNYIKFKPNQDALC